MLKVKSSKKITKKKSVTIWFSTLANFYSLLNLVIQISSTKLFNQKRSDCLPVPVVYLSYDEPWAWVVAVVSSCGLIATLFTSFHFYLQWDSAIVRASGRELSSIMLTGLLLAFSSSFYFTFHPNQGLCGLRFFSFLLFELKFRCCGCFNKYAWVYLES